MIGQCLRQQPSLSPAPIRNLVPRFHRSSNILAVTRSTASSPSPSTLFRPISYSKQHSPLKRIRTGAYPQTLTTRVNFRLLRTHGCTVSRVEDNLLNSFQSTPTIVLFCRGSIRPCSSRFLCNSKSQQRDQLDVWSITVRSNLLSCACEAQSPQSARRALAATRNIPNEIFRAWLHQSANTQS